MLYTLSGPAFAYAGAGVTGLLLGATNPFGWAVLGAAATGWIVTKGGKKAWRNARARWLAKPAMSKLQKEVAGQRNTGKVAWDSLNQSRFWIQKRKLSAISDKCIEVFNAAAVFNKPLKPSSCYDVCTYVYGAFRLDQLSPELADQVSDFLTFDTWVKRILHILREQYTPQRIAEGFEKICLQVVRAGGANPLHKKCKGVCYTKVGSSSLKSPALSAKTAIFKKGPGLYYNPIGRVLLDAMNRVDTGWLKSKASYKYDLYKQVIAFADAFGLYDPNVGGKLKTPVMALTGYPDQPPQTHPIAKKVHAQAKNMKVEMKAAISGGAATAAGTVGAQLKPLLAEALGKELVDGLGEGVYEAAMNVAVSTATAAGGGAGAAVDRLFQGAVNWANAQLERRSLKRQIEKEVGERDLAAMLTALRTLLKDEGELELFGDQFAKVTKYLDTYLTLMRKKQLDTCQEAYDLAVAIFEIQKHTEKSTQSLQLLTYFSDVVDTMCMITNPDYLELVNKTVADTTAGWLAKHPRKMCKGVCFHPTDGELVEMVDDKGNVVGVESFVTK
jgi:hypothetical protein